MERIPGLDAWLTRGPEEYDHVKGCHLNDDYECEACLESEDCALYGECQCDEIIADAKADAAEAKADELRERKYNP